MPNSDALALFDLSNDSLTSRKCIRQGGGGVASAIDWHFKPNLLLEVSILTDAEVAWVTVSSSGGGTVNSGFGTFAQFSTTATEHFTLTLADGRQLDAALTRDSLRVLQGRYQLAIFSFVDNALSPVPSASITDKALFKSFAKSVAERVLT